ncbi:MAG: VOC family protein [Candidatus Peribacteraceae bacterium]|nr:VOC family protein [Candidatus Peribacteraceae bacterium]
MQKISPFLWFDTQAEEAATFYVSVFKDATMGNILRYDEAGAKSSGMPMGSVMTVEFELEGRKFTAINGGPAFSFTEAISFVVSCDTQKEVDYYWERLTDGGKPVECGWLKDKYGLSWQIIPVQLMEMLQDKNPEKSKRVMQAMLQMKKIDIQTLRNAYEAG